jgi:CubicO group peptidase (beta-lactamase class C family)
MAAHSSDSGDVHQAPLVRSRAQRAVAALLAQQVADGRQDGVAVAAFHRGVCVVDAWAGSPSSSAPLFPAASVSKGMTATLLAVLYSQGRLDYDEQLSAYVPAARGLRVSVGEALSHRAGLCPGTPPPWVLLYMLFVHLWRGWLAGWHASVAWLFTVRPSWLPGSEAGYHHVSWSWIAGSVVEGASGEHVRECFTRHIAQPLGAASDMFIGRVPASERGRVASMLPPTFKSLAASHPFRAAALGWLEAQIMTSVFNSSLFGSFCLPSSNGVWTARSVAAAYGALANGGRVTPAGGKEVQLLRPEAVAEVARRVADPASHVPSPREGPGTTAAMGLGFSPWCHLSELYTGGVEDAVVLGHGGMGGSVGFADLGRGLSIVVLKRAYTPLSLSQTSGCPATRELVDCIRAHVRG